MAVHSLPYSPRLKEEAKNWWSVLKETGSQWMEDHAMRLSASLALYTILSLAPLLVITTQVISVVWLHSTQEANTQVQQQLSNLMGPEAGQAIGATITKTSIPGTGHLATIVSVAVLLFSATGVFIELQDSMNTIWGVKPKPNMGIWGFIRNRLLSLGMVFGTGFLLLVSMFISTILTTMANRIVGKSGPLAHVVDVIASIGIITLLFAAIFKFLPDVKLKWRHVWVGAAITAAMFTIGKYALAIYFQKAAPTSAFGAVGAPVAVLLWIYYSSFILFFGAEFTKVWSLRQMPRVVPEEIAVKVTEEERARLGMPSEKRMENALAGKPLNKLPPPTILPCPTRRSNRLEYFLAGGGLLVGAIAGGIGTHLAIKNGEPSERRKVAAAKLNDRIRSVESRLSHAMRMQKSVERAVAKSRS